MRMAFLRFPNARIVSQTRLGVGKSVLQKINAIEPGFYTRMGATIHYASQLLEKEPLSHRLLLLFQGLAFLKDFGGIKYRASTVEMS